MSELPRLLLITPAVADAAAFAPLLEAAMAAQADVACVLLRAAGKDEGTLKATVRALAPIVQERGAALLVAGTARLAARVDADGVHVARIGPDLDEALDALRPRRIVGVGGLRGRDEAMRAGESGVDYLMFGGPGEDNDREAVQEAVQDSIIERVAWWAEIFNVPCVGYAVTPAEAGRVARAGAEFVALCDGLWDDPGGIAATLAAVAAQLSLVESAS